MPMGIKRTHDWLVSSDISGEILRACLSITDWLNSLKSDEGSFVTLRDVSRVVEGQANEDEMLAALSILTTSDYALLDVHGYLDDFESGPLVLDDCAFRSAIIEGVLIHPATGDEVPDPETHLHLFYSLRAEVLD